MNWTICIYLTLGLLFWCSSVKAGDVVVIDSFTPNLSSKLVNTANFSFSTTNVTTCVGGERDYIVLGGELKTVIVTVTGAKIGVSFDQASSNGFFTLQYDGVDGSGALNLSPGLGGYDLRNSLKASSFRIGLTDDHNGFFQLIVYSSVSAVSTYTFTTDVATTNSSQLFVEIPFTAFTGSANFSSINAIEFKADASQPTSIASDLSIVFLGLWGYEISGTAFYDCNNNTIQDVGEADYIGANVTVTENGNEVRRMLTDANGDFHFYGLSNSTYTVCVLQANGSLFQQPTNGCRTVTLSNFLDVTGLTYGFTKPLVVTAPANDNITCGESTDPSNTGTATLSGCGATPNPTFNDTVSGTCPVVITRVWTAPGATNNATQLITVTDAVAPVITTPAQNTTQNCLTPARTIGQWVAANGDANATDCTSFVWSNNWNNITTRVCTVIPVTFTATDPCGLRSNTTASYTVQDNNQPSFTNGPTTESTECTLQRNTTDINNFNGWIASNARSTATDPCQATVSISNNYTTGFTSGCNQTITVGFTASDGCGNSILATASYTISDTQGPVISPGATSSSGECGTTATTNFNNFITNRGNAAATDACSSNVTWTVNPQTIPTVCDIPVTYVFTATDGCGRTSTTSAQFTVLDTTAPNITTPAAPANTSCGNLSSINTAFTTWLTAHGGAVATDSCTGANVTWTNDAPTITSTGCANYTVTFTVSDTCGESARTTAIFSVLDQSAPVYTVAPVNTSAECGTGFQASYNSWVQSQGNSTVVDNCSSGTGISYGSNAPAAPSGCENTVSVNFTATDSCGNVGRATGTFTITDLTAPVFNTLPSNQTSECSSSSQSQFATWKSSNAGASISDACNSFNVTNNATASVTLGCDTQQIVTFTATDFCGNSDARTVSFFVEDTANPIQTSPASNQTIDCNPNTFQAQIDTWLNNRGGFSAVDACTTIEYDDNYNGLTTLSPCVRVATVTFTATDLCDHQISSVATFTVQDLSAPVIQTPAQNQNFECVDEETNFLAFQNWLQIHANATAFDTCYGEDIEWTNNFQTGSTASCGRITVTFFATDPCGLVVNTTATFVIVDTAAPQFDTDPANVTFPCDSTGNVDDYDDWIATNGGASVSDNCDPSVSITKTAPAVGPVGCGTVTVNFIATDDCGQTAQRVATYTVTDNNDPVINTPAQNVVEECVNGANYTAAALAWVANQGGANATDACTTVFWTTNFTTIGIIDKCTTGAVVAFTANDRCAHTAVTTASFTIVDSKAPQITRGASPLTVECSPATRATINDWIADNGGARATEDCTFVTWTNNFDSNISESSCSLPLDITFTATDVCGNSNSTVGKLTLRDSLPPVFIRFPNDAFLNCSACSTVECLGQPTAIDQCSTNVNVTYEDVTVVDPPFLYCPGDVRIARTFTSVDNCGNVVNRTQNILIEIARPKGPCSPDECPPCNSTLTCCTRDLNAVNCNSVPCKPVACNPVECIRVDCIPVTADDCASEEAPGYIQPPLAYGGDFGNNFKCEPIYVYVFDDDGFVTPGVEYEYVYKNVYIINNSASKSLISLFLVAISIIFALF